MQCELTRLDALFVAALLDQSLGQLRAFAISDHPAGNVAAEDVEDHVQVKVRPFRRSEQLGDGCFILSLLWSSFSHRLVDGVVDRDVADKPAPPPWRRERISDHLALGAP